MCVASSIVLNTRSIFSYIVHTILPPQINCFHFVITTFWQILMEFPIIVEHCSYLIILEWIWSRQKTSKYAFFAGYGDQNLFHNFDLLPPGWWVEEMAYWRVFCHSRNRAVAVVAEGGGSIWIVCCPSNENFDQNWLILNKFRSSPPWVMERENTIHLLFKGRGP